MQIYNVDFKKLALLLLPTVLRRPILFAVLKSACKAFDSQQAGLFNFQNQCDVRMKHTPQVCYLKAILKQTFNKNFDIYDTEQDSGVWLITYKEVELYVNIIPVVEEYTIVYTENAINDVTEDFFVVHPFSEQSQQYKQMERIVNTYRLVGKTPKYIETQNN